MRYATRISRNRVLQQPRLFGIPENKEMRKPSVLETGEPGNKTIWFSQGSEGREVLRLLDAEKDFIIEVLADLGFISRGARIITPQEWNRLGRRICKVMLENRNRLESPEHIISKRGNAEPYERAEELHARAMEAYSLYTNINRLMEARDVFEKGGAQAFLVWFDEHMRQDKTEAFKILSNSENIRRAVQLAQGISDDAEVSKMGYLLWLFTNRAPASAVIIARNRETIEAIVEKLVQNGITIQQYRGDMGKKIRERLRRMHSDGDLRCLVGDETLARVRTLRPSLVVIYESLSPKSEEQVRHNFGADAEVYKFVARGSSEQWGGRKTVKQEENKEAQPRLPIFGKSQ
ncbi:MAG: hypothetical protein QXP42_02215 [Candidatus Micrarchaeia archaeon]